LENLWLKLQYCCLKGEDKKKRKMEGKRKNKNWKMTNMGRGVMFILPLGSLLAMGVREERGQIAPWVSFLV
jgi:hypothetical protein